MNLAGAPDAQVFQRAQRTESVLVTTDQGFGDVRTYPPSSHYGVILLKVAPDLKQIQAVHHTLRQLLKTETAFQGTLFIVDVQKYRKRASP